MDDADRYRRESRAAWGRVAAGWGRHAPSQMRDVMPVTTWMLDAVDLQPGFQVLDLAAGPGEVGFLALELIQPGGTLITSDFSPEMLTEAQARAQALGLEGVRFKQIDAESIDLDAGSLDAVLCRWGFMLMADPETALRETRRVLKPGGRLALAAWTGPEDNPWSSAVGRAMVACGLAEPAPPDRPGQFAWADEAVIREHLDAAGFVDDVEVAALDFHFHDTFDAWWARTREMSRVGSVIAALPAQERAALEAALRADLARYEGADGVLALPARSWVAAASA